MSVSEMGRLLKKGVTKPIKGLVRKLRSQRAIAMVTAKGRRAMRPVRKVFFIPLDENDKEEERLVLRILPLREEMRRWCMNDPVPLLCRS